MTCSLCGFEACKNAPCHICTAVTENDEEINQAEATLRRLIAKRRYLRSKHNRVHGTLMHRLPVELKIYIFGLLLPSWDEWGEISQMERTAMPSFLAAISVCKEWRDVALSNPFFWSTMHIVLETSNLSSLIDDWILRSGTLPLTFHIQVANDVIESYWSRGDLLPVLEVMIRCSNRLQSLSLDVPFAVLGDLQHDFFQYQRLTRLRIISSASQDQFKQPLSLLNPTASPERIELDCVSFQSLQISWNRLTSATVSDLDLESLTQLFEHAPQMTFCRIFSMRDPDNFSMPPIIHHRLKNMDLRYAQDWSLQSILLGSLTLPCLQEFSTDEASLLKHLIALVRRSSCPLTKLTLFYEFDDDTPFDGLEPFRGLTDLTVATLDKDQADEFQELLLEGYFPDLRHLTLRLQAFLNLWEIGAVALLLNRKRQPDRPDEGKLEKFIVINEDPDLKFDHIREQVMELGIILRENGFEFL